MSPMIESRWKNVAFTSKVVVLTISKFESSRLILLAAVSTIQIFAYTFSLQLDYEQQVNS